MKLKRMLSVALIIAALCALMVPAATAVELPAALGAVSGSYFTDIADEATAQAAEQLRMLGIVEGVGGTAFNPNGNLTRAEFCKMALLAASRGDEAKAQANRVIFMDVPSTHWALGYINAAATSAEKQPALVAGIGNGNFAPGRTTTLGEAVTILMRILGYADNDFVATTSWWSGYVSTADSLGLLDSVGTDGNKVITRAETARLFANLLKTNQKSSGTEFINTLCTEIVSDQLILEVNATAADGSGGALRTHADTYKMANISSASSMFAGLQADLALNSAGRVVCILPNRSGNSRTFAVAEAKYTGVETVEGDFVKIDLKTVVYTGDDTTTYEALWLNLAKGTLVTAYFGSDGKLSSLYIPADDETTSVVIGMTGSLADLVGSETNYSVFKNGAPVSGSAARTYDVATYNAAHRAVTLNDFRITGVYTDAYPNLDTPARITVLGIQFELLDDAIDMMHEFKLGDPVTLLLTPNVKTVNADGTTSTTPGKVAGVVSADVVSSNAVGIAIFGEGNNYTHVDISLMDGFAISGEHKMGRQRTENMNGELVTVSSNKDGYLMLNTVTGTNVSGNFDVGAYRVGDTIVSQSVRIYERANTSAPVEISYSDLPNITIPASKIQYAATNSAGAIDYLILDDVTGDRYTYGIIRFKSAGTTYDSDGFPNPAEFYIESNGEKGDNLIPMMTKPDGTYGGIAVSLQLAQDRSSKKAAAVVELTELGTVARADFSAGDPAEKAVTVTYQGKTYPVSSEVVCYNARTETWFSSLEQARAYSNALTLYIDRPLSEGGKVRMVVIN